MRSGGQDKEGNALFICINYQYDILFNTYVVERVEGVNPCESIVNVLLLLLLYFFLRVASDATAHREYIDTGNNI